MRTTEELVRLQKQLSSDALKVGMAFSIDLDYTLESVKEIERICGLLHKEYQRTHDDEGLRGIALQLAAYITLVIEKNFDSGDWKRDDPEFGQDSFPYHWMGKTLFPFIWCSKRIFDGPAENVWKKFNALVLEGN